MRERRIVQALLLAYGCALASGFVGTSFGGALHPLRLHGRQSASSSRHVDPLRLAQCAHRQERGSSLCTRALAASAKGGLRITKDITEINMLGDALGEWAKTCELQGVEVEGGKQSGLSNKERVEYVFRAVVSQERSQVLKSIREWIPFALSEHPRCAVLGSFDKATQRLMAMACVEEAPKDEGSDDSVLCLRVRHVAVRPEEDLGDMAGGWTASEDYSALSMCEGVKAHAKHVGLEPDFSDITDVHEGRIFLKTDPFNPAAFGGML
uniref:Uncharacterized protein n=1 Tax=Hemiselmis andersenii TaxID=464988 RepID=A0A7S1DNL5_HEMAN|mmetsp:Transcript_21712/g.52826  ORF Transcript_21712/g.52826 Transcript_21712/m.52826 type:complete len:267 (+) Transcript_21712:174-974(+)|eukprot:CAMPEP_0114143810 /NCGR_PEP_ID=MMETSP0043_2-20121206/19177_1 /TAXON_ID=464988 /ORGANISM="Hemiselmis andersenii, Strain CCMP644" /LENGTH=266 /DNA_ID=CAMNT_0001238117 /DNA_START=162 /DNA_END=962 /DNA_ORIENTATION=+